MDKIITVRFTYQSLRKSLETVFYQPLFMLAMHKKQQFLKAREKLYNEKLINSDLIFELDSGTVADFPGNPPLRLENPPLRLEIIESCLKEIDFNLNYAIDRSECDYKFTYKTAPFHLQTDHLVQHCSLKYGNDEHAVTSNYQITYNAADFEQFEDFIMTSTAYFNKFYDDSKLNANRLKLFISAPEGSYFERFGTRPKRSLDSVFLPKKQKEDIINELTDFFDAKTIKRYAELGIIHKKIMMFAGKPGTGKSSLITALASHFDYNIAIVSFTPKMTDVSLMRALRAFDHDHDKDDEKKVLFVFEDMDCIFKERKSNDESRNMVTFSGILNAFDGISTSENMWCIMTTNYLCNLDSALIRSSRVDKIILFDYAVKEQITAIFRAHTVGDDKQADEFYAEVQELNINVTTSLLQQYLLKYLDKPLEAIANLSEMKKMYDISNISRDVADTNLYN